MYLFNFTVCWYKCSVARLRVYILSMTLSKDRCCKKKLGLFKSRES